MTLTRFAAGAAAVALLAGCAGSPPDPWSAAASFATSAQAGVPTLLRSHGDFAVSGESCNIEAAPRIEILQDGALGSLSVSPQAEPISLPDTPCDGQSLESAGVFYEAAPDAAGFDTVVYRVLRAGVGPDVTYTATIRVR